MKLGGQSLSLFFRVIAFVFTVSVAVTVPVVLFAYRHIIGHDTRHMTIAKLQQLTGATQVVSRRDGDSRYQKNRVRFLGYQHSVGNNQAWSTVNNHVIVLRLTLLKNLVHLGRPE